MKAKYSNEYRIELLRVRLTFKFLRSACIVWLVVILTYMLVVFRKRKEIAFKSSFMSILRNKIFITTNHDRLG